ncbi:S1C family serine protease [Paenibacillus sp. NPDC058174]|uniref:S1C family serine protease n=1 Tax=Paenibacillus sp. NPDC058174 TaxID=3346366 RepID=UPI0036D8A199
MRRNMLRAVVLGTAGALLLAGTAFAAGSASSGGAFQLSATKVNGEVYVKASSLTSQLGGAGSYNESTKTYTYTPADIPAVVEKVSPSVVAIIGNYDGGGDKRYALQHGTGVILKSDGWILTNAHVVKDLKTITVVTADGKKYSGKRSNMDETSDLALVKINATKLPVAKFAPLPLKLRVGESVIAIGTPVSFTLRNSATTGVLSGMNRSISSAYRLLQTDAAINPGNSGGPLVNMKGEIIGINTLKFVDEGVDSLGFSVPADTVKYVTDHFFKYGYVKRASLGFELEESWEAIVGLPTSEPLTVTSVKSDSARKLGIKVGDVLYSVAGKQISSIVELNELLKSYLPGQQVSIMLMIDGDLVTRQITLAASDAK